MEKKKLKKKIWTTSTVLSLVYITILILHPTLWISVLPILIPTGILTVGIPTFTIIKRITNHTNQKRINRTEKQKIETIKNIKAEKKITKYDKTKDKNTVSILETQYVNNQIQKEKPKVKTKGTIH